MIENPNYNLGTAKIFEIYNELYGDLDDEIFNSLIFHHLDGFYSDYDFSIDNVV